jgi:hypothetical protein
MCELHKVAAEQKTIAHRDLKLKNIFLFLVKPGDTDIVSRGKPSNHEEPGAQPLYRVRGAAVGDAGIHRREGRRSTLLEQSRVGYVAPELDPRLRDRSTEVEAELSPKVDSFSFGTLLWSMLHFPKELPTVDFRNVRSNYPLRCDSGTPSALAQLIADCTNYQIALRPDMNQLRERLLGIFPVGHSDTSSALDRSRGLPD